MLPREFVGQLFTSANVAGFDQRQPLPGLAEPGIVIFHAFELTGEPAGRTHGPKPQREPAAGRPASRNRINDVLLEGAVPFAAGKAPSSLTCFAKKANESHV